MEVLLSSLVVPTNNMHAVTTSAAARQGARLSGLWHQPPRWLPFALLPLLWARRPDAFLNPQFWAEDGYFYDVMLHDGPGSIFYPYSGYLHLLPRLAAWIALGIRPREVPALFNAIVVLALLAVGCALCSRRTNLPHKTFMVLGLYLVPAVDEVFFSLTNVQWILALLLVLMLIRADASSWTGVSLDCIVAGIVSLTGPFSVVLAPLFVGMAFRRRNLAAFALAGTVLIGASIQLYFIVSTPGEVDHRPFLPGCILPIFGRRFGIQLFGLGFWRDLVAGTPLTIWGVLCVSFLAVAGGIRGRYRSERAVIATGCAVYMAAAFFRARHDMGFLLVSSERYVFAPKVLFLWLLAAFPWQARPGRVFGMLAFLAFLGTAPVGFRIRPLVDYHWPEYAPKIAAGISVRIPINPTGWFFDYKGIAAPLLPPEPVAEKIPVFSAFPGAFRLTIQRPAFAPGELPDPLVTTGVASAGDVIFMQYPSAADNPDVVVIGHDHWGAGAVYSQPFALDRSRSHTVTISMGSLFPAENDGFHEAHPGEPALRERLFVKVDDVVVLDAVRPFHRTEVAAITIGQNLIGASTAVPKMRAVITDVTRVPPEEIPPGSAPLGAPP